MALAIVNGVFLQQAAMTILILSVYQIRYSVVLSSGRENYVNTMDANHSQQMNTLYIEDCLGIALELVAECASPYNSCRNQCGDHSTDIGKGLKTCSCDKYCLVFQDCCSDFNALCPSVEKEAIRLSKKSSFDIYCLGVHPLILNCTLNTTIFDEDFKDLGSEILVIKGFDKTSTKLDMNITYVECGVEPLGVRFVRYMNGDAMTLMEYHRKDGRLCYVDASFTCSSKWNSVNRKCLDEETMFDVHSACDSFSGLQTRQGLIEFIKEAQGTALNVSSEEISPGDSSNFNDLGVYEMFASSCQFEYKLERRLGNKNSMVMLFSKTRPTVLSLDQVTDVLKWCLADDSDSWANYLVPCRGHEIRKEGQCVGVKAIDLQLELPPMVRQNCSKTYFVNRLIHIMIYNFPFLHLTHIRDDPGKNKIHIQISPQNVTSLAKMSDPYLNKEIDFTLRWIKAYAVGSRLVSINVCIDLVALCKSFHLNIGDSFMSVYARDVVANGIVWSAPNDPLDSLSHSCCFCAQLMQEVKPHNLSCSEKDLSRMLLLPGMTFTSLARQVHVYANFLSKMAQVDWYEDCRRAKVKDSPSTASTTGCVNTSACVLEEDRMAQYITWRNWIETNLLLEASSTTTVGSGTGAVLNERDGSSPSGEHAGTQCARANAAFISLLSVRALIHVFIRV